MRDTWLDLVLGSCCTACGRPGRLLCEECRRELPTRGRVVWPTPCPDGLALPMAAGDYAGVLKLLVNAHKERRQFALARPLGDLLALVVRDLTVRWPQEPGWCLVPVPSRRSVVRARGHDPLLRLSRHAAATLRASGLPVVVSRLLESDGVAQDQAGLPAAERAANLRDSIRCRAAWAERQRLHRPAAGLLVVDDVLTTGSTAREAQRALEAAGLQVRGVGTVAATAKRWAPRTV